MSPVIADKRKCLVCDKEFTTVDYAFHIQEEILSQLMVMNETLADIKEITDMTYEYMNTDDNNEPVNSKIAADDDLIDEPVIDSYGDVELENQNTTKNESPNISNVNGYSSTANLDGNDTKPDSVPVPLNPIISETKTDGQETPETGNDTKPLTEIASTIFDYTKPKESDKLENVTLDDILKRIMDR
jgi:hypothetical protein